MARDTIYCDVLVIGGGAAGLTAAATASSLGLETILAEKEATVGGTTYISGGTIWVPDNPIAKECDVPDNKLLAKAYVDYATNDHRSQGAPDTNARDSYLNNASAMVTFLRYHGFRWCSRPSRFPDYHPEVPGALPCGGRTLDPAKFDANELGGWKRYLEIPTPPLVSKFEELRYLTQPMASTFSFMKYCYLTLKAWCIGHRRVSPLAMGCSLVAQLLNMCRRHGNVKILTSTRLTELVTDGDRVIGGVLERDNTCLHIRARRGVLLASGGFAQNQRMRNEHLPSPSAAEWSLSRGDKDSGDVLAAATCVGAKTTLLHETWGIPTMKDPATGKLTHAMFELAKPHSIIVNDRGSRFLNETQPYGDIVHAMYEARGASIPAWLILDRRYLRRYTLGSLKPWSNIDQAVQSGYIIRGESISTLSKQLKMPPGELEGTVRRWNAMCESRVDRDYDRGGDAYQRFIGDTTIKGNSTMGPLSVGPFFAVRIYPGDADTKGGLMIDDRGRVLQRDGRAIDGLYAAGNITASVFGRASLGAGVTIGPAMTFAYLAILSLARSV